MIADLKEDIRWLSSKLHKKDPLLSSFMKQQSKKLASFSSALQDTVTWDPVTCPQPSLCLTPSISPSWAKVVVHGRKKGPGKFPPPLSLSNRFSILASSLYLT